MNLIRVVTVVVAGYAFVLQYTEFVYLRKGYDIVVHILGSSSTTHVGFPIRRLYVTCALALLLVVGAGLALARNRSGPRLLVLLCMVVAVLLASDVLEYGTAASPITLRLLLASVSIVALGYALVRHDRAASPPNFRWSGP